MPDVDDDRIRAYREGCANYARTDVEARAYAITQCSMCDADGYRGTAVCDHVDHPAETTNGRAAVHAVLADIDARKAARRREPEPED
jgi:hypothetical protein